MPSLRLATEQRFTCASCARCCTRPWEVVVTPAEVASYRARKAARWFRDRPQIDTDKFNPAEGTERDPFEPIAGTKGFHRIRKRSDGACGFLSPANRCRLHEELGERLKPLTCRLFPYSFHPVNDGDVVKASFACPTIVANTGDPISSGPALEGIKELRTEWFRTYPEPPATVAYVPGRRLDPASLKILRASLLQVIGRKDGVIRLARMLEDLARPGVARLNDEAFAEYLAITVPFAATSDKPVTGRAPSWSGRLMQRGFLFLTAATQLQIEHKIAAGSSTALRLKTLQLLAHLHGLAPGVGSFDLRKGRGIVVDVNGPELQPIVQHFLRSTIQTLGTGSRPVLDELAVAVSSLTAACALAKMKAATAGGVVGRQIFTEALVEAADVTHADYGLMGRVLSLFSAGVESLHAFGSPDP